MFDCTSAQMLGIEEALNDSNRRIAQPCPGASDQDFEMLDVILELLFAAEYIINGGGGKTPIDNSKLSDFKALIFDENKNLMTMAVNGENGIKLNNVFRIIKLAFNYESWDIFRRLAHKLLHLVEVNFNFFSYNFIQVEKNFVSIFFRIQMN
jgi:hypothetical protein